MSALQELIQTLRLVEERLESAGGHLAAGRTALVEAQQALIKLDPENPEAVVPPGLRRADDQIERTLEITGQALDTVRDFATRL